MSDAEVARRIGSNAATVNRKRLEPGIPSIRVCVHHEWSAEILAMLGKYPDSEIAKRYGIPKSTVTAKRRKLRIPSMRDKAGSSCHLDSERG